MSNLSDIHCSFVEYQLRGDSWSLISKSDFSVDFRFIENMVNSKSYFEKLGGYMSIDIKPNRRFGMCVSKVVSVSICRSIKRIYKFNYNQARES